MFKVNPILGVSLAIILMGVSLWVVLKYTKDKVEQDKLTFLMVYIVVVLVNSWFIDNVVAFQVQLLDEKENAAVLQVMLSLVSFYLGKNSSKSKSE